MSTQINCDGCAKQLPRQDDIAITGNRSNGFGGGGLPQGEFHWCYECARVAFDALKVHQAVEGVEQR